MNILGQKFEIRRLGDHTLLTLPRNTSVKQAMLHVQAYVAPLGNSTCGAMFVRELSMVGQWLGTLGKLKFSANMNAFDTSAVVGLQVGNSSNLTVKEFVSKVPPSMVEIDYPRTAFRAPTEINEHANVLAVKMMLGPQVTLKA